MLYAECDQEDCSDDNHQAKSPADPRSSVVASHVITFSNAHLSLRLVRVEALTAFFVSVNTPSSRTGRCNAVLGFVARVGDPSSGYGRAEAGFFAQQGQHFFHKCVGGDPMLIAQDWDCAVLDELVGPSDAHDRRVV